LDGRWNERISELKKYKEQNGTLKNIHMRSRLGNWIQNQRVQYEFYQKGKHSCLSNEKIRSLEAIGLEWAPKQQSIWNERVEQLKQYKTQNGNCMVPISYKADKKLANWVSNQRKQFSLLKRGKPSSLTNERMKQLDEIGFIWKVWDYKMQNFKQSEIIMKS